MNPLRIDTQNLIAVQTAEALLLGKQGELTPHKLEIAEPVIIQIIPSQTGQGSDIRLVEVFMSPKLMSIHGGFTIIRIEDTPAKLQEVLTRSYEAYQIQKRSGITLAKG